MLVAYNANLVYERKHVKWGKIFGESQIKNGKLRPQQWTVKRIWFLGSVSNCFSLKKKIKLYPTIRHFVWFNVFVGGADKKYDVKMDRNQIDITQQEMHMRGVLAWCWI
jgi:hypothetical protein